MVMNLTDVRKELAALPAVDVEQMRLDRLHRLQNELGKRDIGAMLLYGPINVSYATDCLTEPRRQPHKPRQPSIQSRSGQVDYFGSSAERPTRAMVNARQVARKNATASIR